MAVKRGGKAAILGRLERLRAAAADGACLPAGKAAVLLTDPLDVGYFSGFTGEDSFLLVTARGSVLLTDGRFAEQAAAECPCARPRLRKKAQTMAAALAAEAGRLGLGRVGFVPTSVTVAQRGAFARALRRAEVGLVAMKAEPALLRQVKDAGELGATRRAVRCAEAAWEETIRQMRPGMTERQVAARLDYEMRCRGASGSAFETIVAAGPNSSLPHARPTDRRIGRQDMVLFDWGAAVDCYRSDLTRVVFFGSIPPRFSEVYRLVAAAQAAGIAALRAGAVCKAVDAAVRAVLTDGGYGKQFVHSTGHGLGRAVHERPLLSASAEAALEAGMVVTIEPGVYLPGVGGIRIEDDCLVTAAGCRVLSRLPKQLERMRLG
jgi:Xaa-Pro aminopeptidase